MPKILVISGPSAVGKTTLVNELVNRKCGVSPPSYTTRKRRESETGEPYKFIDENSFRVMRHRRLLAEYTEVFGAWYGMLKGQIENSLKENNVILIRDVEGMKKVKEAYPDAVTVFINPPSIEVLTERLRQRKDSKKVTQARIDSIWTEMANGALYDYRVTNTDFNATVEEIISIINQQEKS